MRTSFLWHLAVAKQMQNNFRKIDKDCVINCLSN